MRDPLRDPLGYLKESPSQTAGPYVHIGLAPGAAGFDIYVPFEEISVVTRALSPD